MLLLPHTPALPAAAVQHGIHCRQSGKLGPISGLVSMVPGGRRRLAACSVSAQLQGPWVHLSSPLHGHVSLFRCRGRSLLVAREASSPVALSIPESEVSKCHPTPPEAQQTVRKYTPFSEAGSFPQCSLLESQGCPAAAQKPRKPAVLTVFSGVWRKSVNRLAPTRGPISEGGAVTWPHMLTEAKVKTEARMWG